MLLSELGPVSEIARWTQRRTGSDCRLLGTPSGDEIFVKVVPSAIAGAVGADYRTLVELHRRAPGIVPRPIAHGSDPAYVAYQWVDGPTLSEELAARTGEPHAYGKLLEAAGHALARLQQVPSAVTGHAPSADPSDVPSIADLGPWNCIVDGGDVVFIDMQLRWAAAASDVARMEVASVRSVARGSGAVTVARRAGEVIPALRRGYQSGRDEALDAPWALFAGAIRRTAGFVARDLRRREGRPLSFATGVAAAEIRVLIDELRRAFARRLRRRYRSAAVPGRSNSGHDRSSVAPDEGEQR